MKSFHILLLVTTVLWVPTVSSKKRDPVPLSAYKLYMAQSEIDYSGFSREQPVSNVTEGWPYRERSIRPIDSYPSHVAPIGCAWYSLLASEKEPWCIDTPCPYGMREIFRGRTLQKVNDPINSKTSWRRNCPRQRGVRVNATFCCHNSKASTVFRARFTTGSFTTKPRDFTGDCQWIGPKRFCYGDEQKCPATKWRHEVARAAESWRILSNDTSDPLYRIFGDKVCEVGDRIFCCKDSAFDIQVKLERQLRTVLNYLFPVLVRKRNKYARMRVKLIFAPGATRPPTTLPTTPRTTPSTPSTKAVKIEEEKEGTELATTVPLEDVDETQDDGEKEEEKEQEGKPDEKGEEKDKGDEEKVEEPMEKDKDNGETEKKPDETGEEEKKAEA